MSSVIALNCNASRNWAYRSACWENVSGAITYLKEAIRTWKGIKSPEALFVDACKEERKPESAQVKSEVVAWFQCLNERGSRGL
ncbi:hypothetical protein A4S05_28695 [Nostoc sp. KVJ20]|uniref:hypothetical protein n=1 Tax=Nostoc sp. KVJ20 TaxID=457944 RepID=UPI00083D8A5C|nr:hypothetical protein [Nostoc sp. KVJ20]ODH01492.1 hypothetical protein A4S05_28695 [Nostoc sp. KVJ20]